jgi:hypothetical protein
MKINPSETPARQISFIQKMHNLIMFGNQRRRQCIQQRQNLCAILHVTASQFPENERMTQNATIIQQTAKFVIALAQMIDPNGSVNERHG